MLLLFFAGDRRFTDALNEMLLAALQKISITFELLPVLQSFDDYSCGVRSMPSILYVLRHFGVVSMASVVLPANEFSFCAMTYCFLCCIWGDKLEGNQTLLLKRVYLGPIYRLMLYLESNKVMLTTKNRTRIMYIQMSIYTKNSIRFWKRWY